LIGDGEICQCIEIKKLIEVFVVISCETIIFAMMQVEHRSDSIEAISISVILLKPEANVGN
jgi:hypothetical protein